MNTDETNTERVEAVARFVDRFTAEALAEHLIDREADIDRLDKDRSRLQRDVSADDPRVLDLLKEMYSVMVNNSCAHLWSNFVDSIAGMPDLSRRRYTGVLTLKFHFSDVEIAGDIADWDVETAIVEALADNGELSYGYEDEVEVEYEEED